MPKDNTNQPVTDDQSSVSPVGTTTPVPSTDDSSSMPSSSSTPPPVSVLEDVVVPPMVTAESSDSGSAAPVSDVVMPDNAPMETTHIASTPRKKTMSGKVIATILGLFLLVGGVGAGLFLVQQNQNIGEKAEFDQGCYDRCRDSGKGSQVCRCNCGGECTRPDSPGTPGNGSCGSNTNSTSCNSACSPSGYKCSWRSDSGSCQTTSQTCTDGGGGSGEVITPGLCDFDRGDLGVQCGSGQGNPNCTFCLTSATRTCNQVLADRGCDVVIGNQCDNVNGAVTIYYCEGDPLPENQGCQGNDSRPGGVGWDSANHRITGSFCGTVQVDDAEGDFCSRVDQSACNSTPPTNPPPTASPTPITAQCQNVKAYSESWALLTSAQLTALRPTNKVNFCVTGVTTGGSFDKARFTINGVLQPETTTVRPGSTDFCQLYTIPSGTTTFNVTAQIHHITLGWK